MSNQKLSGAIVAPYSGEMKQRSTPMKGFIKAPAKNVFSKSEEGEEEVEREKEEQRVYGGVNNASARLNSVFPLKDLEEDGMWDVLTYPLARIGGSIGMYSLPDPSMTMTDYAGTTEISDQCSSGKGPMWSSPGSHGDSWTISAKALIPEDVMATMSGGGVSDEMIFSAPISSGGSGNVVFARGFPTPDNLTQTISGVLHDGGNGGAGSPYSVDVKFSQLYQYDDIFGGHERVVELLFYTRTGQSYWNIIAWWVI